MNPVRIDEFDPYTDTGRFERIRDLCAIGGTPRIAMYLFESGSHPDNILRGFAMSYGVLETSPPFPDLFAHPEPRVGD